MIQCNTPTFLWEQKSAEQEKNVSMRADPQVKELHLDDAIRQATLCPPLTTKRRSASEISPQHVCTFLPVSSVLFRMKLTHVQSAALLAHLQNSSFVSTLTHSLCILYE